MQKRCCRHTLLGMEWSGWFYAHGLGSLGLAFLYALLSMRAMATIVMSSAIDVFEFWPTIVVYRRDLPSIVGWQIVRISIYPVITWGRIVALAEP